MMTLKSHWLLGGLAIMLLSGKVEFWGLGACPRKISRGWAGDLQHTRCMQVFSIRP